MICLLQSLEWLKAKELSCRLEVRVEKGNDCVKEALGYRSVCNGTVPVVLLYPAATGRLSCPSPTVTVNLKKFKYSQADLVFIHLSLALTLPVKLHVRNLGLMNSLNLHWACLLLCKHKDDTSLTHSSGCSLLSDSPHSDAWGGWAAEMSDSRSDLLLRWSRVSVALPTHSVRTLN